MRKGQSKSKPNPERSLPGKKIPRSIDIYLTLSLTFIYCSGRSQRYVRTALRGFPNPGPCFFFCKSNELQQILIFQFTFSNAFANCVASRVHLQFFFFFFFYVCTTASTGSETPVFCVPQRVRKLRLRLPFSLSARDVVEYKLIWVVYITSTRKQ